MSAVTTTAYYSLKSGKLVTNTYGERNPTKVYKLEVNAAALKKHKTALGLNGLPTSLSSAKLVRATYEVALAKLEAAKAERKAKKAGEGVAKAGAVLKKTAKKAAK